MILTTPTYGADWKELSMRNDPPGMPSVRAAKVATQGMSRAEMTAKLAQFHLALKFDKTADSVARSVLRREINLLIVALENK